MIPLPHERMRTLLTGRRKFLMGSGVPYMLLATGVLATLFFINARYTPAHWQPMLTT
jgi:hypothetical protein